jgi:hypothetical protein
MFDALELELFRRYQLDPQRIHIYRSWLANESPVPWKEVRARLRRQAGLQKRLEKIFQEMLQFQEELRHSGICYDNWMLDVNGSSIPPGQCGWNMDTREWKVYDGWKPGRGRIIETYCSRPDKPQALRVWNRMLIAFRQEPKMLMRVRGEGYWAVFTDHERTSIHIGEGFLDLRS